MLEAAVRETAVLLDVEGAVLMMPDLRAGTLVPHDRSRYGIARHLPYEPIPFGIMIVEHPHRESRRSVFMFR